MKMDEFSKAAKLLEKIKSVEYQTELINDAIELISKDECDIDSTIYIHLNKGSDLLHPRINKKHFFYFLKHEKEENERTLHQLRKQFDEL